MGDISQLDWRYTARIGLLAGLVALYTSMVGMIETFSQRSLISGWLTLGQLLLFASALIAGYLVAGQKNQTADRPAKAVGGLAAGALAGLPLLLLVTTISQVIDWTIPAALYQPLLIGQALLSGLAFAAGYRRASQRSQTNPNISPVNHGLLLAALAVAPLLLAYILTTAVNLRAMFVNVSPPLIRLLTFDRSDVTGALLLMGVTTLLGLAGALLRVTPRQYRRPLITGVAWTLILGLLAELLNQLLRDWIGPAAVALFFRGGTLQPTAAVIIFFVTAGLRILWDTQKSELQARVARLPAPNQVRLSWGGRILGLLILLLLPQLIGPYLSEVLGTVGLFIMMGLGLNIAVGLAGLLDLGYVANFAIGAYVMGVLTSTGGPGGESLMSFWTALPISILAAMTAGFVLALPVLRMRGDYLAIATLGFGEITRILALSDWLSPYIGGAQGILFIPKPRIAEYIFRGPQQLYYIIIIGCLLAVFVSWRLNSSRTGRRWMAIREDEDVAAAMGINLVKTKVLAFTLSAAFGGLAGAIFAAKLGTIFPHSFNLLISINVLSLIIVGGMGSLPGVIVGAFVLVGLPELLREFAEYRLLLYGALLIVMMLSRPEGLWPSAVRQRELHEVEEDVIPTAPALPPTPGATGQEAEIETFKSQ